MRKMTLEMVAHQTDTPAEQLRGLFAGDEGHATPKVDLRGVVFRDGQILLVRERQDRRWRCLAVGPMWVVREVRQKSGYEVRAVRMAAVLTAMARPRCGLSGLLLVGHAEDGVAQPFLEP